MSNFHQEGLPNHLAPNLNVLFCGINPGVKSWLDQHHYAHRSNHFWPCLNESGLISDNRTLCPENDWECPELYRLGFTNLCRRHTKSMADLKREELVAGVQVLLNDILEPYRPRILCMVGREISRIIVKHLPQDRLELISTQCNNKLADGLIGSLRFEDGSLCLLFQMPSTSARSPIPRQYRLQLFQNLAHLVRDNNKTNR